jgi:2-methylcitrate dehydratase PrpD
MQYGMPNPIHAYGSWLAEAPRDWPAAARDVAHRQFVDIAGVALRGAVEEPSRRVFATVAAWGSGPCSAVGTGASLAAPWAALVNGTAAHALDFDDNFDPGKGARDRRFWSPRSWPWRSRKAPRARTASTPISPASRSSGRVGQGVNPVHRTRGWHATATVGAIGAAAAAARILRLPVEQAGHALSIATSMAGGFMSQFGTMTKPLHAGLAAQAGVMAASLARGGIDAGADTLDRPRRMNRLMVGPDYEALRDQFADSDEPVLRFEPSAVGEPLLILSHGLRVKRFPNCGSAHRSMDADLGATGAAPVRSGRCRAGDRQRAALPPWQPHVRRSSKRSPGPLLPRIRPGAADRRGECRLSDFAEQTIMREDIRALYPRIRKVPRDGPTSDIAHHVEVQLASGEKLQASVTNAIGSRAAPFSWDQQWAKLDACVADLLAPEMLDELKDSLESLPELTTVAPLMRSLGASLSRPSA